MRKTMTVLAVVIAAALMMGCAGETQPVQGKQEEPVAEENTEGEDNSANGKELSGKAEAETNAPETPVVQETEWKEAYLQVLDEYRYEIVTYEEMLTDFKENNEVLQPFHVSDRQICLEDLNGDDIPELLFAANTDRDVDCPETVHDLYVFSYINGSAQLVHQGLVGMEAGGGVYYHVALEGDRLVTVCDASDGWHNTEIRWYELDGDSLQCVKEYGLFIPYYEEDPDYKAGDDLQDLKPVSEEEYNRLSHQVTQGVDKLLIYNMKNGIPVFDFAKEWEPSAMSYRETVELLGGDVMYEEESSSDYTYSDYFTDDQIEEIRASLGVPEDMPMEVEVSDPYYWDGGDINLCQVDFYIGEDYIAGAACEEGTANVVSNIYVYSE